MKTPKSTKRKGKGFWLTGLLFLVLLGSGVASIYYLFEINNKLRVVLKHKLPISEMITRITVHKLEQTAWLERALRHAEVAALGQQNNEENTRLLKEAKAKFKEFSVKVKKEIEAASNMSMEAQQLAEAEELMVELRRVDESLVSIREGYVGYVKRVDELLDLFVNGNIRDAEKIANETEKLEEGFNQRLESFLFETEEITRQSLSAIGEREGKAIIVIAIMVSIALVFTITALVLNSNKRTYK
jgi:methyl-accepting chemotaxis protein